MISRVPVFAAALPILLGCVSLLGCSSGEIPLSTPVDVAGTWTADFLVNTSDATTGKEVNPFGEITLEAGVYKSSSNEYVGNATMASVVFAPQGSVANPTMDSDGMTLAENVGSATYGGTWSSAAFDGNTSFSLNVSCEKIMLTAQRPDLMAVCGGDGFDASIGSTCSRPDGATTFSCQFGAGDIVFHRK
jgi:hypothetical protein